MNGMRSVSFALASAVVAAGLTTANARMATAPADDVKLTGCLVRGTGDGYLLVNLPSEPAAVRPGTAAVAPGAVGTSGSFANIFYWLGDHKELRNHIGHQVEVEGDPKGEVKRGEIKIDRKEEWTEIKVKSDGSTMKAQVPNASVIAGPDANRKIDVLVRRVNVEKVRMLGATCR